MMNVLVLVVSMCITQLDFCMPLERPFASALDS